MKTIYFITGNQGKFNEAKEKFLSSCKDLGWDGVHNEAEKLVENRHYKTGILEVLLIDSLFNYKN